MVCIGSEALQSGRHKTHTNKNNLIEEQYPQMSGEGMNHLTNNQAGGKRKGSKNRRTGRKQHHSGSGGGFDEKMINTHQCNIAIPPPQSSSSSILRKPVDPETAKYFSEIANLYEGADSAEIEEHYVICGNNCLLIIVQALLEGAAFLCGFLQNSANVFPLIAMDRSGSHVTETALKALAVHLQDNDMYAIIEETLTKICQTALKLLAGEDKELLMNIIPNILACHGENTKGNCYVENFGFVKRDSAFSHLMEVNLEVVPETLYHEILTKDFRNRLIEVSSTHFGSFIQPSICSAKTQDRT
ncbi:hypothetical protein MKW92_015453 [Papaver armeniacum]|nr:hypothetical protein MKW92_015453 [Papaver armeniacum]